MGKRHDEVDNSLRIIEFHVDFKVGLPIEAPSARPETFDRGQWMGAGQQRANDAGARESSERFGRGDSQMDEARRGTQQICRADVGDPSSTWRQNHRRHRDKFFCYFNFQLPEFNFTTLCEEPGDGNPGPLFDFVVKVKKWPVQLLREGPPDGGLAGTGQSDKDHMAIKLTAGGFAHPKRSSRRAR